MNEKIKELINNVNNITYINNQVIIVDADRKYIIKRAKRPIVKIYKLLKSKNLHNVNYPIKEFEFDNEIYFIYLYIEDTYLNNQTKLLDLINNAYELHDKTGYIKKTSDLSFKRFKRIYKRLDYAFLMLESIVRKSEMSEVKTDFDWIILSKYYIFLDAKKELYNLQLKIHRKVNEGIDLKYAVIHNKLSIDHLINNKLISFDSAKMGYYISDYAKLYVLNDYININYVEIFDKFFNEFDKTYFKFITLYIYILNLEFDNSSIFVDNYLNIAKSIKNFMKTFENYK